MSTDNGLENTAPQEVIEINHDEAGDKRDNVHYRVRFKDGTVADLRGWDLRPE